MRLGGTAPGIPLASITVPSRTRMPDDTAGTEHQSPATPESRREPRIWDPEVERLDEAECWRLISAGGAGRLAYSGRSGLAVLPVGYQLQEGSLLFRIALGSPADEDLRTGIEGAEYKVAVEIDDVGTDAQDGWFVLIQVPRTTWTPATITHQPGRQAGSHWLAARERFSFASRPPSSPAAACAATDVPPAPVIPASTAAGTPHPASGCWNPVRFHGRPAPTPRAAARIYVGWANLRRGLTAR